MDPPAPGSINEVFDRAREGDVAFIKTWLDRGGDVNEVAGEASPVYNRGKTVIMAAAARGQIEMMRLLVSRGADVNFVRAGFAGAARGANITILALVGFYAFGAGALLEGALVDSRDRSGRAPVAALVTDRLERGSHRTDRAVVLGKNGPKPKRLLRSRISLSLCLSIVPLQGPPFSHVCLYRDEQDEAKPRLVAAAKLASSVLRR